MIAMQRYSDCLPVLHEVGGIAPPRITDQPITSDRKQPSDAFIIEAMTAIEPIITVPPCYLPLSSS